MQLKHTVLLSIQIEKNNDGYLATVPGIQGAFAEGDTIEEAIFNCVEVVKMISAYRTERNEGLGFNKIEWTQKTRMTIAVPIGVD